MERLLTLIPSEPARPAAKPPLAGFKRHLERVQAELRAAESPATAAPRLIAADAPVRVVPARRATTRRALCGAVADGRGYGDGFGGSSMSWNEIWSAARPSPDGRPLRARGARMAVGA